MRNKYTERREKEALMSALDYFRGTGEIDVGEALEVYIEKFFHPKSSIVEHFGKSSPIKNAITEYFITQCYEHSEIAEKPYITYGNRSYSMADLALSRFPEMNRQMESDLIQLALDLFLRGQEKIEGYHLK